MRSARSPLIALVSHGFQSNYERGFCNGLADAGVEFTLICSDGSDLDGLRPGVRTLNLRGSQAEQRPRWRKALNLLRYHLSLMAWVAWRRPAVLHVFGLIEPPNLIGVWQGRWWRAFAGRYVLTVHDTEPHDQGDTRNRQDFAQAFLTASQLVVHTQRLQRHVTEQLGIPAERVTVMEHGLEPLPASVAWQTKPQGAPLNLLMFGMVMRYKGIDLLLDALEGWSRPFSLVIAGRCQDEALTRELADRIGRHGRSTSIRWENAFVPEERVSGLFIQADALVLPYRRIDQSGVLLQAYRHGLPIVASRVGAFEDYVDASRGELCEPGDAASLRLALERLWQRRTEFYRARLADDAQCLAWSRTVTALFPVYGVEPTDSSRPSAATVLNVEQRLPGAAPPC